jgi:protein arginine kinase activator
MLCQKCNKRAANIQFVQVINNNKHVVYLCENCAKEEGKFSLEPPLSVSDFLSGIIGVPHMTVVPQQQPELVCDNCGISYEEFLKFGKLGCANCYRTYGDKLVPLLKRLHRNVQYNGKIPGKMYNTVKASREIEKLKELLNKAVKEEAYEKAAELRDKIKSLESSNIKG